MHPHISKLYNSALKPSRLIIGLMSGTSLDGLDVALCKITAAGVHTQIEVLKFTTVDYSDDYKTKIKQVFAKRECNLEYLTLLHPWVGKFHGDMVNQCLNSWQVNPANIDVIASHGQTIYHCPKSQHQYNDFNNGTLQIGDSDQIAVTTGITTIGDFRQKHIAAGGEGAPLAVYGDYLFFSSSDENRILLNMGGIANLTFLPQNGDSNAVFSSDIGPCNTIMDAYVQRYFNNMHYDENAAIAKAGFINTALLTALCDNHFLTLKMPKTTGPEVFNLAYLEAAQQASNTQKLSHQDVMATLNRFTAEVIANALNTCVKMAPNSVVYASGGGIHNLLLMQHLVTLCPAIKGFKNTHALGVDPDAKEAVLFAILANECLAGEQLHLDNKAQGIAGVTMGKVSFAD
ncbi:anhydro-N-acetylmuramic acid kinase [Pseudoalteromonas translucida]|uniref:Anhydro-N-acetylmuramic acid kinase n=1 Tax=Pseudoalteromonas translucida (strain TAC 125) TaxID=326442 RepID=ANMK_PSET1|nr:anhydro-N-acetylmuramic acid kinase [Pseudoalteromonas translucida]Q3ICY1.1 RecName: Full=Anhydro-N-acetylmuramic acid kinase; AltName: Full=AnhMurNAc kinase [Pseudoalteromonas translucida TAC125]CAI89173.1 putative molecular chaperone [Pseudoalteromonas translucida]